MFKKALCGTATLLLAITLVQAEGPDVSFSGYLDSDVWTDFEGNFYTNDELDLGLNVAFSEKISADVFVTILTSNAPSGRGSIPAGDGHPAERWVSVAFDGVGINYESDFGTFTVGDLVYQYGGFNYYFYKRLSMITPENFTRGVQYSIGSDAFTQTVLVGVTDMSGSSGDIIGASEFAFSQELGLALYYGVRGEVVGGFGYGSDLFAGTEFNGSFGEAISVKLDIGFQNFATVDDSGMTIMDGDDPKRFSTIALLLEPGLSLDKLSTALSVYYVVDPDESGHYPGADEQFFAYVEPGFAFTDVFALGLPLEVHSGGLAEDLVDTGEFWVVPTGYIYPFEKVEWWIWAGGYFPFDADIGGDPYYALGSEIIVNF
ncbi:MAG: hypothetical protein GF398_00685 [Chitinivibrionales bacterium]|nr:hypothetical protein [Chitinivibrionales bacterium]